jgi:predicted molibdopterin-dependent oxidoreductase YjgC
MGYDIPARPAGSVMNEIAQLVESYGGVNYARLERGGLNSPVTSFADQGNAILTTGADGYATINPSFIPVAH